MRRSEKQKRRMGMCREEFISANQKFRRPNLLFMEIRNEVLRQGYTPTQIGNVSYTPDAGVYFDWEGVGLERPIISGKQLGSLPASRVKVLERLRVF